MDLIKQAKKLIPGGVNSPVRAFKATGCEPFFVKKSQGAFLYDVNDYRYTDYVLSFGPLLLGHGDCDVQQAVAEQIRQGFSFGATSELEVRFAELLTQHFSIDKVRLVNSGTEAVMSAIRLARGFSGRDSIIKFHGCYHGHSDDLLVKAGSGLSTFGISSSRGVPAQSVAHTIVLPFNDLDALAQAFDKYGSQIGAVIIEPIAGNMNLVPAQNAFIKKLRKLCDAYQSVLIFDEVMSGVRADKQGAQAIYQTKPDLLILGKVIGGGFPLAAFGGRADIMDKLAPDGDVYQAGTLSGNPVAVTAGMHSLNKVLTTDVFEQTARQTEYFINQINFLAQRYQKAIFAQHVGTMFGLFFSPKRPIENFDDVKSYSDEAEFKKFFAHMLSCGQYFAPSMFEAGFFSCCHSQAIVDQTLGFLKTI